MRELVIETRPRSLLTVFFFNDTATTEIYTLSLHDALPISVVASSRLGSNSRSLITHGSPSKTKCLVRTISLARIGDRKSTRLNSSHGYISYAVFCLKKKKGRRHAAAYRAGSCCGPSERVSR